MILNYLRNKKEFSRSILPKDRIYLEEILLEARYFQLDDIKKQKITGISDLLINYGDDGLPNLPKEISWKGHTPPCEPYITKRKEDTMGHIKTAIYVYLSKNSALLLGLVPAVIKEKDCSIAELIYVYSEALLSPFFLEEEYQRHKDGILQCGLDKNAS
ncbi:unnamed protein product [Mytilus edulis]|uniref:Uncharacterized protein n=1 Tax=Mytilus edulis TaxID=6550 RepID=A0A8S3UB46_MYTED|nr:unnamed protein product [Mytilus edulis]